MTRRSLPRLLASAVLAGALLAACGSSDSDGGSSKGTTTTTAVVQGGSKLSGDLTVSDAASLTKAFEQIGKDFEDANPGTHISFNPDSSAKLADQIEQGAPADVFASADEANMDRLVKGGEVTAQPKDFARNKLVIITKPGNPAKIQTLSDLATAKGTISLCGQDAPCGKYAAQILSKAGVTIPEGNVTRGQNVSATTTAVSQGDAVAGLVYVTDALTAGDQVQAVAIPDDQNAIADYPIAALHQAKDDKLAQAFVDWVTGTEGQRVLKEDGFLPPQ